MKWNWQRRWSTGAVLGFAALTSTACAGRVGPMRSPGQSGAVVHEHAAAGQASAEPSMQARTVTERFEREPEPPEAEAPLVLPDEPAPLEPTIDSPSLDCTPQPADGYVRGKKFPITLVTVDEDLVERQTANAFVAMADAARADGIRLRIRSGFRSMASQQYLYECYLTSSCNWGNLAAKPGYSLHQSGYAIDIDLRDADVHPWLLANASRFGFADTVRSEPWHWVYEGGADVDDRCA